MFWYSHLFKNFPQFVVIYTVKGFSVVNEEVDKIIMFFTLEDSYKLAAGEKNTNKVFVCVLFQEFFGFKS